MVVEEGASGSTRRSIMGLGMASLILASVSPHFPCLAAEGLSGPLSIPNRQESAREAKLVPRETADRIARHIVAQGSLPPHIPFALQLEAVLALYDVTGDAKYLKFVSDSVLSQDPSKRLDPFSSAGFDLFRRTRNPADMGTFEAQAREEKRDTLRAFDGAVSFYRDQFSVMKQEDGDIHLRKDMAPIFVDHLQEYSSRMAKVGWLSGEQEFFREATQQILIYRRALRDPDTGLWAHGRGWYGSAQDLVAVKWGRAQAWVIRALVETLTYLPRHSRAFRQVSRVLREMADTLLRYQDSQGFWHEVVDVSGSFRESSATGLISYYFARGVYQRYLPEEPFQQASARAFDALSQHRISSSGIVYGGVKSTAPQPSLERYLQRPTPAQDPHAMATAIFSAVGQLLSQRKEERSV